MHKEFEVHPLNEDGIQKAKDIAEIFDLTLTSLLERIPLNRETAIVRTKLEEACFFAKKSMANDRINQKTVEEPAPFAEAFPDGDD